MPVQAAGAASADTVSGNVSAQAGLPQSCGLQKILASVSQHQRQKNGEQTINRMRARTMNGYWCFAAPIGYRYKRISGHGNMLVREEPLASIIQEALEGFAGGRFETQGEMKHFLESRPA